MKESPLKTLFRSFPKSFIKFLFPYTSGWFFLRAGDGKKANLFLLEAFFWKTSIHGKRLSAIIISFELFMKKQNEKSCKPNQ